jgi:hypothetical protein
MPQNMRAYYEAAVESRGPPMPALPHRHVMLLVDSILDNAAYTVGTGAPVAPRVV